MMKIIGLVKFLAVLALKILSLGFGMVLAFQKNRVVQGLGLLLLGAQLAVFGSQWYRNLMNQQTPSAMHDPDGYNAYKSEIGFSGFIMLAGIGFIIWGIVTLVSEIVALVNK